MSTTDPIRAALQRFIDATTVLTSHGEVQPGHRLILTTDVEELEEVASEARELLAQAPEPAADPTDDSIEADFRLWYKECHGNAYYGAIPLVTLIEWTQHDRSRSAQPPEPAEGPSDEELLEKEALLPPNFIDSFVDKEARKLLIIFYAACQSEGGTTDEVTVRGLRAVLAHYATPRPAPIPVAKRLPKPGDKVIAHYVNQCGKARTIMAEWVPAKTRIDESDETEYAEYDEERDCYYWPEGWYELVDNWDGCGSFKVYEGEVTHWQPLPKLPHDALPVPTPVADVRYEYSVFDSETDEWAASGEAPTLEDAIREGNHYLAQYNEYSPHRLELREVRVLPEVKP